jgi:ABC-2 type transport system permease protein
MLTYKCFFKIVKANISTFLLYSSIFIVMAVTTSMFASGQQGEFVRTSVNIGVVNRDADHQISQALISYLEELHTIVPMNDDIDVLTDKIFFNRIRYALIIDENFGVGFTANDTSGLWHITTPQNAAINILVGRQIDVFLQTIKGYLAAGFDYDQAIYLTKQDHKHTVTVLSSEENTFLSRYFSSLIFITFTIVVMSLSLTLMAFKEKDLANRLEVSPTTPRIRIIWFTLAGGSLAYGLWALMMIPAYFLHHESLFSFRGALHMLNSFVLVTVCVCIAILLTQVAKNEDVVVRITTLIGVLASITGGPFVNLEDLNITAQVASRFTPSFWHNYSTQVLYGSFLGAEVNMADFWMGIGIQLGFAAALFAVALLLGREKKQAQA